MSKEKNRLQSILNAHKKLYDLLTEPNKTYKDNDEILLARYWQDEFKELPEYRDVKSVLKTTTTLDFLKAMADGKLRSAEDVIRARRLVQQHFPETRGERWNKRHLKAKEVSKGLVDG